MSGEAALSSSPEPAAASPGSTTATVTAASAAVTEDKPGDARPRASATLPEVIELDLGWM